MVRVSTLKHALAGMLTSAALARAAAADPAADPAADIGKLQQVLSSSGDVNGQTCSLFLNQVAAAVDDIQNYEAATDMAEQNYQLALVWFALCVNEDDAASINDDAASCNQLGAQSQSSLQSVVSPVLSAMGLGFDMPCATLLATYRSRVGGDPPLNVPQDPDATPPGGSQPTTTMPAANPPTTTAPPANGAGSTTTTGPASTTTVPPGNNQTTTDPPTPPEPTNGAVAGKMPMQNCLLALTGAVFFATSLL